MKFVDVKYATLRELDQICRDLKLNKAEVELMRKWYSNSSEVWAGFVKEELCCIYGVCGCSFLSDAAYLWLTVNELVHEHQFIFVRHSQMVVKRLLESHKMIIGHVSAKSPDSIRWLEWLGVKLKRNEIDNDMIPFELKRSA